jgi:uncharacterized protein YkwD
MKPRALTSSLLLAVVLALTVAAPVSAHTHSNSTYRWRLFLEINQVRRDHGLRALHIAPGLRTVAQNHSNDMVNRDYFSHTSPTGSTLFYRITHSTFRTWGAWCAGENLAWGTGETPIKEMLRLVRDKKWNVPASIELEYSVPADSDAVKEVRKCVQFCKDALA